MAYAMAQAIANGNVPKTPADVKKKEGPNPNLPIVIGLFRASGLIDTNIQTNMSQDCRYS